MFKNVHGPFLELDLSMHVNKTPFHLVTQSLYAFRPENLQSHPVLNQEVLVKITRKRIKEFLFSLAN
jgi:hypothetical protein